MFLLIRKANSKEYEDKFLIEKLTNHSPTYIVEAIGKSIQQRRLKTLDQIRKDVDVPR